MSNSNPSEEATDNSKGHSKKLLWVILGLLGLLLIGGGGAAAFFLLAGNNAPKVTQQGGGDSWVESTPEGQATAEKTPAIYYELTPTFMVKIANGKQSHYLQVDVSVMSRDQLVIDAVKLHKPLIVSELLAIFNAASYDSLFTIKGKRELQIKALDNINGMLRREEKISGVRAVLFTNFMVQ